MFQQASLRSGVSRNMGHAGAITSRSFGTAGEKIVALKAAGVRVELNPARIRRAMQELLSGEMTVKT